MCGGGGCCPKRLELRMGNLYQCDCYRFNGLQDKCCRSECQCAGSSCFTGSCQAAQYPLCIENMTHGIDIRRVRAQCPGQSSVAAVLGYCSY